MTLDFKQKLRQKFITVTNREPFPNEEINMEKDTALIARVLLDEYQRLSDEVDILKKK